jgi:hypothetical protein
MLERITARKRIDISTPANTASTSVNAPDVERAVILPSLMA